jgi:polysaccharide export outer membrane protein
MKMRSFLIAVGALLMAAAGGSAFAQSQATSQPAPGPGTSAAPSGVADTTSNAYILGRDDSVEVSLVGGGYANRARVQADGTIQLPLAGKMKAADLTTAELADNVAKALKDGGFYANPIVTVEVVGYASRYVTVLGAVGNPGLIPINRPYHVSEILARVGGVREGAADYLVIRSEKGEEKHLPIKDLATGDLTKDPYVAAGDKIYAPAAELFYISGQVKSPGSYPIQTGMTARMAIARGGGLTDSGSEKKLDVMRAGKKVKLSTDDPIQAGDVITVGERLF